MKKLAVGLLCGGPSLERGISLNSARSAMDHLHDETIEIVPFYFDHHKNAFKISRHSLYSNTPSDFDFKLSHTAKPLSKTNLIKELKKCDIVFPAIHGHFGEDGEIQRLLENNNIPYIGSTEEACKQCFDKYKANNYLSERNFYTYPSALLKIYDDDNHKKVINDFFAEHDITRAIIKPAKGGSSISVYSVGTPEEALEATQKIFSKRIDTRVVLEPFCEGVEFTVIVLQNRFGMPVALFPTEVEIDYSENQIFDYRKKYLATRHVTYHCPPRFREHITEKIQIQSEQLFKAMGMRHVARFDGWHLPNGQIWFSDINPVSGMEQNSFLFLQGAQCGFSHKALLRYIVRNACREYNIPFPEQAEEEHFHKKPVQVLFGGKTAERQVSLISGTNVWLKLRKSKKIQPTPYLLDIDNQTVWRLPYAKTLNHTVEEISENCQHALHNENILGPLRERIIMKLNLLPEEQPDETQFLPDKMSLSTFVKSCDFTFLGLHGGIGENGTLQQMLSENNKPFNGSRSDASKICMDKYETAEKIKHLEKKGIYSAPKMRFETKELFAKKQEELATIWKDMKKAFGKDGIIVKPADDGCSAGITILHTAIDVETYLQLLQDRAPHIPANTFKGQHEKIEMPGTPPSHLLFEKFIKTDKVSVIKNELKWQVVSNYIEITMGLLGYKGAMYAMNPSLTVAAGTVLSLEEKFQGGTGVNITPPPQPHVSKKAIEAARERMELVANTLGIEGYARIDAFMHTKTGELIVIEANSLPGLTPSTVIYHQALAEKPIMDPTAFLEKVIEHGEDTPATKQLRRAASKTQKIEQPKKARN